MSGEVWYKGLSVSNRPRGGLLPGRTPRTVGPSAPRYAVSAPPASQKTGLLVQEVLATKRRSRGRPKLGDGWSIDEKRSMLVRKAQQFVKAETGLEISAKECIAAVKSTTDLYFVNPRFINLFMSFTADKDFHRLFRPSLSTIEESVSRGNRKRKLRRHRAKKPALGV